MSGLCQKILGFASSNITLEHYLLNPTINTLLSTNSSQKVIVRTKKVQNVPKLKYPLWHLKKERVLYPDRLTQENAAFVRDVTHDKFGPPAIISGLSTYQTKSPLKNVSLEKKEWTEGSKRCGLITRKIGCYPVWNKKGVIVWTTLLQVVDNHVIKYIPPEENIPIRKPWRRPINQLGALLIGAESSDPQKFTKEYCGLFAEAGLPPKKLLVRFHVTPNAFIQPGTPLFATHFSPGDVVDVAGLTINRGFQGVMKRWGFKGMPASHGVTKTHRRGGNIGGGGEKGRVWPGTKMPGHMGNDWRVNYGLKIWRINTKYNVLYVQGLGVPGETNSVVHVFDTRLPLKKKKEAPKNFPTFFPDEEEDTLPEDLYDEHLHVFDNPTITFEDTK